MITVRNVLSAVSAALSAEFGGSEGFEIYLDNVPQGLAPPCFTVSCSPSVKQMLGKRFRRDFDFCIHFFPGTDEPYGECADVEERLFSSLQYITVDGDMLRGENMSRKFSDGVLSFNVSFGTFVLDSDKAEAMGDLHSRIGGA